VPIPRAAWLGAALGVVAGALVVAALARPTRIARPQARARATHAAHVIAARAESASIAAPRPRDAHRSAPRVRASRR
jgi:hypothetical protein